MTTKTSTRKERDIGLRPKRQTPNPPKPTKRLVDMVEWDEIPKNRRGSK